MRTIKIKDDKCKLRLNFSVLVFALFFLLSIAHYASAQSKVNDTEKTTQLIKSKYEKCKLKGKLSLEIFKRAYFGLEKLKLSKNIITIIDFDKPSTDKRFFVIDLKNEELLFETYTAHGKNSGVLYAKNFANKMDSNQSSLGFYKTGSTYQGEHGYSLRLLGLEKEINDKAYERAIVIHGADYVSESFIKKNKRLGRSWGCPALPASLSKDIIDKIKNGTCLFIYATDDTYLTKSKY
ncbi:MAG: hypothetical protein EAZ08_06575 [Cytophagales bacterium]|nr:MAG: hypothetical protein EAZ08_06575 [Cytophagales bacterium]